MVCSTTPVKSNIKQGYFIFGEQEITFYDVMPSEDMILIIRFYNWPDSGVGNCPWDEVSNLQPLSESEEWVVAWTACRLTKSIGKNNAKQGEKAVTWNTGTHILPIFHCPVPAAFNLAVLPGEHYYDIYDPYGSADVRIHIFSGKKPEFPFHPESPVTMDISTELSPVVFIHHMRETPPSAPFHSGDGFHLYIDGARFLPDAVTISRVTGRILDRNYNQIGPDISTGLNLNSNIYEPFYNYHIEIRTPAMPPSATLLLKVYSVDHFTMKLALIGWAALNLFVESGTETQPSVDLGAIQISLNEGGHQLRLYSSGPDTDKPFSVRAFVSAGRYIPCATLLVRLRKAQTNKKHQMLESNDDSQAGQEKTSPLQPRPNYSDGVYFSDKAKPTQGEKCLYSTMVNRSIVLVREIVAQMAGDITQDLETDDQISDWIKKTMSRQLDSKPRPFNMTFVTRYRTQYGVKGLYKAVLS
ncbi:uncharacterized protein LOC122814253 [Protopterus annectens]|uniref:uncharacterized protein LOC122814253 n=1 Tax=Protopterus annectens TaxID=7888 RepID=UPI001CFA88C5|nr:uncharacterized protein LOC122814253 [Protopterus annectens]